MRGLSDQGATVAVLGHTGRLVSTKNGELDTLETHQALADIIVGARVDSTALGVAEKLIEGIISCTLTDFVVVGQLL
jgi:molybdopterin-guanine dinucleotide biosynthesis protein